MKDKSVLWAQLGRCNMKIRVVETAFYGEYLGSLLQVKTLTKSS